MPSLSEAGRRLRDELRVEPTPVDGLRRRRIRALRRRGALASVAVAAVVGGLVAAIGSNHASEHVVVPAAPGVSTTTGSGIGGQTATSSCTLADLERPVPTGMPTPTVVSSPVPIGGGVKVGPPAPGQSISSAAISAQQVWSHHYLGSVPSVTVQPYPGGGTNEMYLGSFYDSAIGQTRLVWLLERTGVALNPTDFPGGPLVSSLTTATTATTATRSACQFYTLVVIVDATTGQPLQEGNFLDGSPTTSSGTTTSTTASTDHAPPTTPPPSNCRTGQINARLEGIQGATGNWAAAFWIADTAPQPCMLTAPARIDLLNSSGQVQLTASSSFSPIPLTANTAIPSDHVIRAGKLAYLSLFWPTDGSFAGGHCPTPDFVPSAARITFGSTTSVTVTDLQASPPPRTVAVCGQHISIPSVGPLTPN